MTNGIIRRFLDNFFQLSFIRENWSQAPFDGCGYLANCEPAKRAVRELSRWLAVTSVITWHMVRIIPMTLAPPWPVFLNHDGTDGPDGLGIQSVSPVPSASAAGPSVPSFSNSRSN